MLAVPGAALLDALGTPVPGAPAGALWITVSALLAVGWAVVQPGSLRSRRNWETPFDGLLLALLALSTLGAVAERGAGPATRSLQQVLACIVSFLALTALGRRSRHAARHAWRAFGVATALLGAHALWTATLGAGSLRELSAAVDARWIGRHGLARTLLFATLATAGRALENRAPARWRVVCVLGLVAVGIHAATGSLAPGAFALSQLDRPLEFSGAVVTWMIAVALARGAWARRGLRLDEAWRWRGLATAAFALGLAGVLGDAGGGEGVRAMAVLAGVAVLAPPPADRAGDALAGEEESEPAMPRAA